MSFLENSVTIFSHFLKQYCRTGPKKHPQKGKEQKEKEKEKKKPSGCNGSLNPRLQCSKYTASIVNYHICWGQSLVQHSEVTMG